VTTVIAIRRCVLRIRRLGGWSWGSDPEGLLRTATGALPRLIAERLRIDDATERAGGSIDAPIRLRVVASVDELAALAAGGGGGAAGARIANELQRQLAAAIATSSIRGATAAPADAPARTTTDESADAGPEPNTPSSTRSREEQLLALLAAWHRDGVLVEIATALPAAIVARWSAQIARACNPTEPLAEPPPELAEAEAAAERALEAIDRDAPWALCHVIAAGAIAATKGGALPPRAVAALAGHVLLAVEHKREPPATVTLAAAEPATAPPAPQRAPAPAAEPLAPPAEPPMRSFSATATAPSIVPALPFLALVPLSRCRWLAALAELLPPGDAAALIAAITYKVLDPPEHGWRRSPRARAAATALCGEPLDDAWLHAAAARIAPLAGALVAPLRADLRRGHTRGAPLALVRDGELHFLFETAGMFVLAVAHDPADAIAAARGLGEPVLVPAATATRALLDRLELANLVFVTDAPPARGEPWRAVPGARLWTNDGSAEIARRAALASQLADAAELAGELIAAFAARPALPRGGAELDLVATHAAAIALADLAWTLFGTRELATPVLALERFATLDAKVAIDDARVDVAIPLGRRHSDLLAHGYLTTIPDAPWLGGRVIEIHGG